MKRVGAFTYDAKSSTLTGPEEYMRERGDALLARVASGADPCGAFAFGSDDATALLVTLQTDYAGWCGTRDLLRALPPVTREITNVLGETRPARLYPDGSYACPFCGAPVFNPDTYEGKHPPSAHDAEVYRQSKCVNPGCSAYPTASREYVLDQRRKAEERKAEDERRQRDHERAMARIEEAKRAEQARWVALSAQAGDRGACRLCLRRSNWRYGTPKFIQHRTPDYHEEYGGRWPR